MPPALDALDAETKRREAAERDLSAVRKALGVALCDSRPLVCYVADLQAKAERLTAELAEKQALLDQWELLLGRTMAEALPDELESAELRAEVERLSAVVDRLPKTADGVPVVPGMELASTYGQWCSQPLREVVEVRQGSWRFADSGWYREGEPDRLCYTTTELAKAAVEQWQKAREASAPPRP